MKLPLSDRAAVRFPPPFVFGLVIAAGLALDRWYRPLSTGGVSPRLGDMTLVVAGALLVWAMLLFRRTGQDPAPWTRTPEMIFRGPYRFTRNPMYLGMAVVQIGIGLRLSNAWVLAFLPLSLYAVYHLAIRHEEAYLERKFGDAYRKYKASVRRWL